MAAGNTRSGAQRGQSQTRKTRTLLGQHRDSAMDALRRELHFLALRRGTPTALTAVA